VVADNVQYLDPAAVREVVAVQFGPDNRRTELFCTTVRDNMSSSSSLSLSRNYRAYQSLNADESDHFEVAVVNEVTLLSLLGCLCTVLMDCSLNC
jgi:hypothetical protein